MRLIRLALVLWAVVTVLVALFLRSWFRERSRASVFPASQASTLLAPARRLLQQPRTFLTDVTIGPGDTVLELGPGPGFFTVETAGIVGSGGRVVACDLQPEMCRILRGRLREHGIANAQPVAADAHRLPLAGGSVDKAFVYAVLGEIPDRPAAIAELLRVLRPGGVLGFGETLTDPDYTEQRSLDDLCRAVGFERLETKNGLLGYTMTFRAPER